MAPRRIVSLVPSLAEHSRAGFDRLVPDYQELLGLQRRGSISAPFIIRELDLDDPGFQDLDGRPDLAAVGAARGKIFGEGYYVQDLYTVFISLLEHPTT